MICAHRRLRAPPPEMRPSCGAPPRSFGEVKRIFEAERHPLEHGAGQGAAVVADAEPDERAARVRVGVRGPLAGEVGEEQQVLGARGPGGGFVEQYVERRVGVGDVAEPGERAGGREHHPHRVPGAGDRVAERVDARLRVRGEFVERREHHAGCPERHRHRSLAVDSDSDRAGGLIATAGGYGRSVSRDRPRVPGSRARLASHAGSMSSACSTSSLQARFATSRRSMPDASETSVACSPVRRRRT